MNNRNTCNSCACPVRAVNHVYSLASARLCRGEARLARRIDIENNLNTCAPHTAGESGFAPTLNHWRARHASPLQSRQGRITSNFKLPTCAKRIAPLHIWAPQHPRPRALTVPLGAGSRMRQMAQNKKTTTQPRRITAKRMAQNRYEVLGTKYEVGSDE